MPVDTLADVKALTDVHTSSHLSLALSCPLVPSGVQSGTANRVVVAPEINTAAVRTVPEKTCSSRSSWHDPLCPAVCVSLSYTRREV